LLCGALLSTICAPSPTHWRPWASSTHHPEVMLSGWGVSRSEIPTESNGNSGFV